MADQYPPATRAPIAFKRLQIGNAAFFYIREDEMDKVIGIHDFAYKDIFLFEGRHRHARQKFRQFDAIVSAASLERFDSVYTLHGAEAWLGYTPGSKAPQYLNVGSLTVKSPVLTTSLAYPDLAYTLIGSSGASQRTELGIVLTHMKVSG